MITKAPSLTALDVSHCGKEIRDAVAYTLAKGSGELLKQASFDYTGLSDEGVTAISTCCPSLTLFTCTSTKVGDTGVVHLCGNCHHITVLKIENLKLTDTALFAIAAHCREMTKLSVAHNKNITDRGIMALAGIQLEAEQFSFDNRGAEEMIVEDDMDEQRPWRPLLASFGCLGLRALDVSDTKVTATGLSVCFSSFEKLNSLSADSLGLSSEERLLEHPHRALTNLSLAWNDHLTDRFLLSLVPSVPSLRVCSLAYCPKLTMKAVGVLCQRADLAKLHIRGCKAVNTASLKSALLGKNVSVFM
jgi:hypothetical protein